MATQNQLDDERKENEYRDLIQLSEYSPLLKIQGLASKGGMSPTRYQIIYTCLGYSYPNKIAERFVVTMQLPADYPRALPLFQHDPSTPIHHPHVFPSFSGITNYICIGHDNNMPLGLPLREYVIGVGEMIQWRKGVQPGNKPVDERPFEGQEPNRVQAPSITSLPLPPAPPPPIEREEPEIIILSETSNPTTNDFTITISPDVVDEIEDMITIEFSTQKARSQNEEEITIRILE